MENRIRELREAKGWSMAKLGDSVVPPADPSTINKLEKGYTKLTTQWMERIAAALEVRPLELIEKSKGQVSVKVVGYVGTGHEIYPVDDHMLGAGLDAIDVPAGLIDTVAVVVRGDSMWPRYDDGDKILYRRFTGSPDELLNQECVVKLTDDRMFVKVLRRGSQPGLYVLFSHNAPPIDDAAVEWAAPVQHVERTH